MNTALIVLSVYVLLINVLLRANFMNDQTTHAKTLILLVAVVGGGYAAFIGYHLLPVSWRSFELIHGDAYTLTVGILMFVVLGAYRFAMSRVSFLKRLPASAHAYFVCFVMLLSLAGCVTLTAVR